MPPLNLALFNLSASVCEDQPLASEAYASAMNVTKVVLDAEPAHLVDKIPAAGGVAAEPASLHLTWDDLHLQR